MLTKRDTTKIATSLFVDFMDGVVGERVFNQKERSEPLSQRLKDEIAAGKRIDTRVPDLTLISGKGGWHPDAKKAMQFAVFSNVSLLDHLISVVRGSLMFAALDLSESIDDKSSLKKRLSLIACVAFLHDADKIAQLARIDEVTPDLVASLMNQYGIPAFLNLFESGVSAEQMTALIDEVEVTRSQRFRKNETPPSREQLRDCVYIRLADQLDGLFLHTAEPRIKLVQKLQNVEGFRSFFVKQDWRIIEISDPNIPFLLDQFQEKLSDSCRDKHGYSPLIEVHHDGQFTCILPQQDSEIVLQQAIAGISKPLSQGMRITLNARGKIDLIDSQGDLNDLNGALDRMDERERCRILCVHKSLIADQQNAIDKFLQQAGEFLPRWPNLDKYSGNLVPMWSNFKEDEDSLKEFHKRALGIATLLACTDEEGKSIIPKRDVRESELKDVLQKHFMRGRGDAQEIPTWLEKSDKVDSRLAILSAYSASASLISEQLDEAIFGTDGLLELWLIGSPDRLGLNHKIKDGAGPLKQAIYTHFTSLLSGQPVIIPENENDGRCHFTNQPVARSAAISGKTGLYGVNISAFSGRDGRPETFLAPLSETLVSPIAEAEHRLRQIEFGKSSGLRSLPVHISSPTTAGLFGGLLLVERANEVKEFSFADLLRADLSKDKPIYLGTEGYQRLIRIARYEEMPTRLVSSDTAPGQISFIVMVMKAALRLGRPIHVFRGAPRPTPSYVSFDFLPPALSFALGGQAFRLEQIPEKIDLLKNIEAVATEVGFGVSLAKEVADPNTRFAALCDARARCDRIPDKEQSPRLRDIKIFTNMLEREDFLMTSQDSAVVLYGEAIARIQRAPRRDDGNSYSELGLRIAIDACDGMSALRQTSEESLIAATAGSLQRDLGRNDNIASSAKRDGDRLMDAIQNAAEIFVRDVWMGAFRNSSPSGRVRRIAFATFKWSFERAAWRRTTPDESPTLSLELA